MKTTGLIAFGISIGVLVNMTPLPMSHGDKLWLAMIAAGVLGLFVITVWEKVCQYK